MFFSFYAVICRVSQQIPMSGDTIFRYVYAVMINGEIIISFDINSKNHKQNLNFFLLLSRLAISKIEKEKHFEKKNLSQT